LEFIMKRIILIVSVTALLAVACGSSDVGSAGPVTTATTAPIPTTTTTALVDEPTVPTTQPVSDDEQPDQTDQVFVELFYVHDGRSARSVIRGVDETDAPMNAMSALIGGPTPEQQSSQLSSAIPADTLLLGLVIQDGLATIDLSREFEVGGGSFNILSRLAQVVYTLTSFSTVDEVLFHLDGRPVDVFSGEGVVLDDPVDRSDYATILPIDADPDTTAAEPWAQADLPDLAGVDPDTLSQVANVADDDVLNVRQDPNSQSPIVGMLLPGVVVERTGINETVGSSVWVQIETPVGGFWVNNQFLAPVS
jgi:spore germination protein GerM